MKIIVGEKVFLQKFVMAFMEQEFYAIPGALYVAFIERYSIHFIHGPQDALKFDYEFDDEQAVKFLKDCEYIFDFVEYSKKSAKELRAEMDELIEKFEDRAQYYDQANDDYKEEHGEEMHRCFDETRLMCEQLKFMIACKTGELKFPALPEGAEANLDVEKKGLFARFKKAPK